MAFAIPDLPTLFEHSWKLIGGTISVLTGAFALRKHLPKLHGTLRRFRRKRLPRGVVPEASQRPQVPFVTRNTLSGPLEEAVRHALSSGCIVWVTGESGAGKTRLVEACLRALAENGNYFILRVDCQASRDPAPYMSLLDSLEALHTRDRFPEVFELLQDLAPSWYTDITSEHLTEETRAPSEAAKTVELRRALSTIGTIQPIVLFFDDIQFADEATLRLLSTIFASLDRERILIVLTCPTERIRRDLTDLLALPRKKGILHEIVVPRFDSGEIERLVRQRFPAQAIPGDFVELIDTLSEGNAFLANLLLDNPAVPAFLNNLKASGPTPTALEKLRRDLPGSLRDAIAERLRPIASQQWKILDFASLQGSTFDSVIMAAVLGQDIEPTESQLDELQRLRIVDPLDVYPLDGTPYNQRFRFHHVQYRDYISSELKPGTRASYALKLAQAHEKAYARTLSLEASRLADLYALAGKPDRELEYRVLAAEASLDRAAFQEALAFSGQALALPDTSPPAVDRQRTVLRATLVRGLCQAVLYTYAFPAVRETYTAAVQLASGLGDERGRFRALSGAWLHELVLANLAAAERMARQLVSICDASSAIAFDIEKPQARWALGVTVYFQGNFAEAESCLQRGIDEYRSDNHKPYATAYPIDPGVSCRYLLGRSHWMTGRPDRAMDLVNEAEDLANKLGHGESQAFALASKAIVHHLRGEPQAVHLLASALKDRVLKDGLRQFAAWPLILDGWATAVLGRPEDGAAEIRRGLDSYEATRSRLVLPSFHCILADALIHARRFHEAEDLLSLALTSAGEQGQIYANSELLRLKGEAILRSSPNERRELARELFTQAQLLAHTQGALGFELRAAISLAASASSPAEQDVAMGHLHRLKELMREGAGTQDIEELNAMLRSPVER